MCDFGSAVVSFSNVFAVACGGERTAEIDCNLPYQKREMASKGCGSIVTTAPCYECCLMTGASSELLLEQPAAVGAKEHTGLVGLVAVAGVLAVAAAAMKMKHRNKDRAAPSEPATMI